MLPVSDISLVDPSFIPSGSWLLRAVHHDDGPAFRCTIRDKPMLVQIGGAQETAFHVEPASDRGPWVAVANLIVEADPLIVLSPQRGSIPIGSICMIGEEACLSARFAGETVYLSVKRGVQVEESYGRFASLPNWRLIQRESDGERFEVFSSVAP